MGIDTDLNVVPYNDDYDPNKKFTRILFRPGRALQARELTQLQAILQDQVSRFGSNVFKEGTIISGINPTEENDISYVKINDQANLSDLSIFDPTQTEKFFLSGNTSGLRAEILATANGFQTRDPNLKTFFLKYLNTAQLNNADVKQFIPGEVLSITDIDGITVFDVTVNSTVNSTGKSYGVSVSEGIIYQKGHFLQTDPQLIIIEKYTNIPGNVSVGFVVEETIITSDQDPTLLDNAAGFNNENAPGADRLKLTPLLSVFQSDSEPENFFSLIRFKRGLPVQIRDVTQYNVVGEMLARRTSEESGDYRVRGFEASTLKDGNTIFAAISPGKAYVDGYEVENASSVYIPLESANTTQIRTDQAIGLSYGGYYQIDTSDGSTVNRFFLDGSRYSLYSNTGDVIGSCSIKNLSQDKLFVSAIQKLPGEETTPVFRIEDTPVVANTKIISTNAEMVFNIGKNSMKSLTNVSLTRRFRQSITTSNSQITISANSTFTPLASNLIGVSATDQVVAATGIIDVTGNLSVTLSSDDAQFIYYDAIVSGTTHDTLTDVSVYVKTTLNDRTASIGLPNVIELLEVIELDGSGAELQTITSHFMLDPNQKDGYYGHSNIVLKSGQTPTGNTLLVKVRALRRTTPSNGGYLTPDSYQGLQAPDKLKSFVSSHGTGYNLLNCVDFRPYQVPVVSYSVSKGGAGTVNIPVGINLSSSTIAIPENGVLFADEEFYLSRIDKVTVNSSGEFEIIKGTPSEIPRPPADDSGFTIASINIPGNSAALSGLSKISVNQDMVTNYTMKDIQGIEQQVNRLNEAVTLTLLETQTQNLFIPDENGFNRFKNGFLVDSFRDLSVADLSEPDYFAAIDRTKSVCTPAVQQWPIELKVSGAANASEFENVFTASTTGTLIPIISQPYATNSRNCVSNFYSFAGTGQIFPQYDSGYDVVQRPDVNIDTDFSSELLDFWDNLQEVLPLTVTDERIVSTNIDRERTRNVRNITTTQEIERTVRELTANVGASRTQTVGNFVTDVQFKPFMQRREIRILVNGLRPNTRHYFYFDEVPVNQFVFPGVLSQNSNSVNSVRYASGIPGGAVSSNSEGTLSAIFLLPAGTFYVGESDLEISDVDQYESIDSAGTSYSKITYRAYNYSVSKSALKTSTRDIDFSTTTSIQTTRNVTNRIEQLEPPAARRAQGDAEGDGRTRPSGRTDPISQTFFVKRSESDGTQGIFVANLELFFARKSLTNGATVQLREVLNGYPTAKILPFASKHLTPSDISVSSDGSVATVVTFDDPVFLESEKEYAFVVIPDANDPDYLLYISRVGGNDLASGVAVTQDWGDGILFTSTNNRAWKSYQDEDVKFTLNAYEFDSVSSSVDFQPNDYEFFDISATTGNFLVDENVYAEIANTTVYSVDINSQIVSTSVSGSIDITVGDAVLLKRGTEKFVSVVLDVYTNPSSGNIDLLLDQPNTFTSTTTSTTLQLVLSAKVSYFNPRKPDIIHLKGSTARENNFFVPGQELTGVSSSATASITQAKNLEISYFQPMISMSDKTKTASSISLVSDSGESTIPKNDATYLLNQPNLLKSKSKLVDLSDPTEDQFTIRANFTNIGFQTISTLLDKGLSMLQTYTYYISSDELNTSKYISKTVILDENFAAEGMKFLATMFRPAGAQLDVYARFAYKDNPEQLSDWIELDRGPKVVYSSSSNISDYREFEYTLNEIANPEEYVAFQIKMVLRYSTQAELEAESLSSVTTGVNLFPHVKDYRAIALT